MQTNIQTSELAILTSELERTTVRVRFNTGPICQGTLSGVFYANGSRFYIMPLEFDGFPIVAIHENGHHLASFPLCGEIDGVQLWPNVEVRNDEHQCYFKLSNDAGQFVEVSLDA